LELVLGKSVLRIWNGSKELPFFDSRFVPQQPAILFGTLLKPFQKKWHRIKVDSQVYLAAAELCAHHPSFLKMAWLLAVLAGRAMLSLALIRIA
jgi:hypothetical protein